MTISDIVIVNKCRKPDRRVIDPVICRAFCVVWSASGLIAIIDHRGAAAVIAMLAGFIPPLGGEWGKQYEGLG